MIPEATPEDLALDLSAIQARAEAATPGPWRSAWDDPDPKEGQSDCGDNRTVYSTAPGIAKDDEDVCGVTYYDGLWASCTRENAAFIAAARSEVPALVRLAAHWQAEERAYRALVESIYITPLLDYAATLTPEEADPGGLGGIDHAAVMRLMCERAKEAERLMDGIGRYVGDHSTDYGHPARAELKRLIACTWAGTHGQRCRDDWQTERTGQRLCLRHAAIVELAREPIRPAE